MTTLPAQPGADLAIFSERVLFSAARGQPSSLQPATVIIERGAIKHVVPGTKARVYANLDVGPLAVMPGLVDTHVHVNEPGRTEWEGFDTAGRAAAAGGITSIVVMPLNCSPVVTNAEALRAEIDAAEGVCRVDFGAWGGLVRRNVDAVEPLWNAGVLGFKAFMVHSGINDFSEIDAGSIRSALGTLDPSDRPPVLVHAEDPAVLNNELLRAGLVHNRRSYMAYLASRPSEAEVSAIEKLLPLTQPDPFDKRAGLPVHIVHVSSELSMAVIAAARAQGLPLTAETCPHYLTFAAEDIPDGATQFKCAPPIRGRDTREALWEALRNGSLDLVASDHSPCPPAMKLLEDGDFARAWGGISSLQVSLAATWTGAHARGFTLADIARWMSQAPAQLAGLHSRKGRLAPGFDADLIVFDPEAEWVVRGADLEHRHKLTPYDGLTLRGVVHRTILRGETIFERRDGANHFAEPRGQWLRRNPSIRRQA